jgi:Plasmid pRiA4b ORF-3-like protein
MSAARSVARIKVTLKDVEPVVMRRLEVPLRIRLDRLHLVLQAAMGWTDSHLYAFTAGGAQWGEPDPFYDSDVSPAAKATLLDVIEDTGSKTIHYLYDFGDGWDHVIKLERVGEANPRLLYPLLITAAGRCPPEDVGGPPGYAEFLEAVRDPDHHEHERMLTWTGGPFDPEDPDIRAVDRELETLARKWAPRPRRPKTSRA